MSECGPAPSRQASVIVVGSGPTGLTAANLLGRYGVRTLLVERNLTAVQEPRAVSIDDESLRTMQAIGAIDMVSSHVVAGYGSEYLTPGGKVFLKVEPSAEPYGYPRRNAFRQPVFEQQLRDHLQGTCQIQTLFGWNVIDISQTPDHVLLIAEDPDGQRREISADYVVAADGASSFVRTHLGLPFEGETFSERWLIIDLEESPAQSRETLVFCDARRPCIALPGPNATRRFEFKLLPQDDPEEIKTPAAARRLLALYDVAPTSRIVRQAVYTFHARLSSRWREGRIFLAGDACHLTPPFAGQGMNSGIRDAHNIAWKLAWVLRGALPPSALDSYQLERRDHVMEMIRLALRMGRIMGPRNPLIGALTQGAFRLLGLWPPLRDYFGQMKYKPKPRFKDGLLVPDGRSPYRTSVGRLLPQPRVLGPSGRQRLDDLLGDGFALIAFLDGEVPGKPSPLDWAAFEQLTGHALFQRLKCKRIVVADWEMPARRGIDTLVINDPERALAAGLDQPQGRVFLVRPDRYVMASFVPETAARTSRQLAAMFCSYEAPPMSAPRER